MKRKLDLNINNTFRSANLNFINFKDYGKINKNDMDYDVTKKYIIYADDINFNFLEQLCKDLYEYIIITSKPIPTYLLFDIGSNNNASILYNVKEFSDIDDLVDNITLCSKTVSCGLYYRVNSKISITDLFFNIYKLKYILDRIVIDCKSTNLKIQIYRYVYEVLARWRVQLWFNCTTEEEKYLDEHYEEFE